MNWAQLRAEIVAALGSELGTYTLPNGVTTEAIAISLSGNYPPAGTTCQGLEVVITPSANLTSTRALGRGYYWTDLAAIALKQWDAAGSTEPGIRRLVPILPGNVEILPRVLPNSALGNIETVTINFNAA